MQYLSPEVHRKMPKVIKTLALEKPTNFISPILSSNIELLAMNSRKNMTIWTFLRKISPKLARLDFFSRPYLVYNLEIVSIIKTHRIHHIDIDYIQYGNGISTQMAQILQCKRQSSMASKFKF